MLCKLREKVTFSEQDQGLGCKRTKNLLRLGRGSSEQFIQEGGCLLKVWLLCIIAPLKNSGYATQLR
jgi:hypothetical protein